MRVRRLSLPKPVAALIGPDITTSRRLWNTAITVTRFCRREQCFHIPAAAIVSRQILPVEGLPEGPLCHSKPSALIAIARRRQVPGIVGRGSRPVVRSWLLHRGWNVEIRHLSRLQLGHPEMRYGRRGTIVYLRRSRRLWVRRLRGLDWARWWQRGAELQRLLPRHLNGLHPVKGRAQPLSQIIHS